MPTTPKKNSIYTSEEGIAIRAQLEEIESSELYKTRDSYSANGDTYPDHVMPFVDQHMLYLSKHPDLDPQHYLSNLRLKIKIRS